MSDWTKIPQEFLNIIQQPIIVNTGSRLYYHDQATNKNKFVTEKAKLPAAFQNAFPIYYYKAGECNVCYIYKDPDDAFIDIYYNGSYNSSIEALLSHQTQGLFCHAAWLGFRILTKHDYKIISIVLDLPANKILLSNNNTLVDADESTCVNAHTAYSSVPWSTQDLRWGSCTCHNPSRNRTMDPQHQYLNDLHADTLTILKEVCNAPGYSRYKASTYGDEEHVYGFIQMAETEPYKASNAPRFSKPEFNTIHKLATKSDNFVIEINNNCVDIKYNEVYYHMNLVDSKMWATALKQNNKIDFFAWKELRLRGQQQTDVFDALIKASPNQEIANIIAAYKNPETNTYYCLKKIRHVIELYQDKKLDAITKKYIPQYAAVEQKMYGSEKLQIGVLINSELYHLANDVQKRIMHQIITTQENPDIALFLQNLTFLLHPQNYGSNLYGLRANNELFIRVAQIAVTRIHNLMDSIKIYSASTSQTEYYDRHYNSWQQIWQYFHFDIDTTNVHEYMRALQYICQYAKNADDIQLLGKFCFIATNPQHAQNIEQIIGNPIFQPEDTVIHIHEELLENFDNYRIWINEPYLQTQVKFASSKIEQKYNNGYAALNFTVEDYGSMIKVDAQFDRDAYYIFVGRIIYNYLSFWGYNHMLHLQPIIK